MDCGKTETLKLLSSLLFFPNYYLTLCMNWAAMEIEANKTLARSNKRQDIPEERTIENLCIPVLEYRIPFKN